MNEVQTAKAEYLVNAEAISLLRTSETTLWRLRREGEIPFTRIGTKLIYRRSDLEAFLERTKRNGGSN